jgi:hypothetical protein
MLQPAVRQTILLSTKQSVLQSADRICHRKRSTLQQSFHGRSMHHNLQAGHSSIQNIMEYQLVKYALAWTVILDVTVATENYSGDCGVGSGFS